MPHFSDPSYRAGLRGGLALLLVFILTGCASLEAMRPGQDEVNSCTRAMRDQRQFCRAIDDRDRTKNLYRCLEARRRIERECALGS